VRRRFAARRRPTIALNAHGDVVPPGEGWTHDPYGGEVVDGKLYGRASAVSKSDFATYTFALRALEAAGPAAAARSSCTSPTTRSSAANWAPAGC
jgi:succinyl-diaminopimelate desuccinylase